MKASRHGLGVRLVAGVAILIALVSAGIATRAREFHAFSDLRAQLDADVHALHLVGERHDR